MELNVDKSKKIVFSISIANIDITALKGKFIIYFNDISHIGFSVKINNGKMIVNIPPLREFNFIDKNEYKAELWVFDNNDYYTIAWRKNIIITKPINIKTKISIKEEKEQHIFVTKPIVIKE